MKRQGGQPLSPRDAGDAFGCVAWIQGADDDGPRLKLGFLMLTNLAGINGMYLVLPKVRNWNTHRLDVLETNEEREAAD